MGGSVWLITCLQAPRGGAQGQSQRVEAVCWSAMLRLLTLLQGWQAWFVGWESRGPSYGCCSIKSSLGGGLSKPTRPCFWWQAESGVDQFGLLLPGRTARWRCCCAPWLGRSWGVVQERLLGWVVWAKGACMYCGPLQHLLLNLGRSYVCGFGGLSLSASGGLSRQRRELSPSDYHAGPAACCVQVGLSWHGLLADDAGCMTRESRAFPSLLAATFLLGRFCFKGCAERVDCGTGGP